MSEPKKDKAVKNDSVVNTLPEKDTLPFVEGHSQDADRHRKIKHPISDK